MLYGETRAHVDTFNGKRESPSTLSLYVIELKLSLRTHLMSCTHASAVSEPRIMYQLPEDQPISWRSILGALSGKRALANTDIFVESPQLHCRAFASATVEHLESAMWTK